MNKFLLFLAVILASVTAAKSQTVEGSPRACGGETFGYSLSSWSSSTIYKWKITKGRRSSDGATEFCGLSANITWDSDLANDGKIQVSTVSDCSSTFGTILTTFEVKKFDFVQGSPMPTTNGTCASSPAYPSLTCGASQDIDVWFMLPLYGNTDYNLTTAYDFTANLNHVSLPTGWTILGGSLISSTYECTELGNAKYKRIMVTVRTDGVHQGDVKVRVSRNCSSGGTLYGTWSSAKTFSFGEPNVSISGPSFFCSSGTYTISNLPTGATVSWSSSSTLTITSSTTGNTITVNKNSSGSGAFGTITATINTGCGIYTRSINILLGWREPIIYGISETSPICPVSTQFANNAESADGYYDWHITGGTIVTGQGTSEISFYADALVWPNTSSTVGLTLTIHDPCGNNIVKGISIPVQECSGGGGGNTNFRAYPNPANSELKIVRNIEENTDLKASKQLLLDGYRVKLLNKKGKVLKESKISPTSKEIVLLVADVPNGIYYLHIYEGKKVSKQQVIISH